MRTKATGAAFPIGTKLSNIPKLLTGAFREYDEKNGDTSQYNYFTQTPGHNDSLVSHGLVDLRRQESSELKADPFDMNLKNPAGAFENVTLYTGTRSKWTQWKIQRQGENRTNYWVLRVPKQVIRGHGPIFSQESCDLMAALFRIAAAPEKGARSFEVKVKASAEGSVKKTEQRLQRLPEGETIVTPAEPASEEASRPPP